MKNSSFRFDFRRNPSLSRKFPLSFVKPIAEQDGSDVIVDDHPNTANTLARAVPHLGPSVM